MGNPIIDIYIIPLSLWSNYGYQINDEYCGPLVYSNNTHNDFHSCDYRSAAIDSMKHVMQFIPLLYQSGIENCNVIPPYSAWGAGVDFNWREKQSGRDAWKLCQSTVLLTSILEIVDSKFKPVCHDLCVSNPMQPFVVSIEQNASYIISNMIHGVFDFHTIRVFNMLYEQYFHLYIYEKIRISFNSSNYLKYISHEEENFSRFGFTWTNTFKLLN